MKDVHVNDDTEKGTTSVTFTFSARNARELHEIRKCHACGAGELAAILAEVRRETIEACAQLLRDE